VFAGVFGFKPNFFCLDIDQAFGVALEAQGFDVGVFDVLFALGGLQLGVEAHGCITRLGGMADVQAALRLNIRFFTVLPVDRGDFKLIDSLRF
jgi:hypothetical protein